MPSPFPGIDPFIEGADWEDFHHTFITHFKEALVPQVQPRYAVRVELRVYQQPSYESDIHLTLPDVTIYRQDAAADAGQSEAEVDQPTVALMPIPEEVREAYLTVRDRETDRLVTVIELLSPSNKRSGSAGRAEYLQKRELNVKSNVHMVELDFLRGGERLPMSSPLPAADYYAIVSRSHQRPRCDLYHWTIRQRLPSIPIPLAEGDRDAVIDLNRIFEKAYDGSGYAYSLDYSREVRPKLDPLNQGWVREQLREKQK